MFLPPVLLVSPEPVFHEQGLYLRLLGVRIDRLWTRDLFAIALQRARNREQTTIFYVNAHCMNVASSDVGYARILEEADVVYCDGTGVRLGAWLSRRHLPERMTGADWIDGLCHVASSEGLVLYLVGGPPEAARDAARVLTERHVGLRIAGTAHGYDLGTGTIAAINEAKPDIVLVGMGTPRQEKWIAAHRQEIQAPVVWAVGALFEFVTGRIPRGPRWMTNHGMEWVCRLAAEPRKLWRRYLIGNPYFLWRILLHYWLVRSRSKD